MSFNFTKMSNEKIVKNRASRKGYNKYLKHCIAHSKIKLSSRQSSYNFTSMQVEENPNCNYIAHHFILSISKS